MRARAASDARYMHGLVVDNNRAIQDAAEEARLRRMHRGVILLIDFAQADENDRAWAQRYGARRCGNVYAAAISDDDAIVLVESMDCPGRPAVVGALERRAPEGNVWVVAYSSVVRAVLVTLVGRMRSILTVVHRGREDDVTCRVRMAITCELFASPRPSRARRSNGWKGERT